ncbi:MAG: hypothetical protein Q6354_06320 [Candidatus Brocadiales bacterium]|nr:hypothetical protein [Candidatus Brocadiales bacterium]
MRKDYIYQDKGQFNIMYNAHKIGGFLVSDQDVIPDERVLPERRFAHQPIFRRPTEELVATTYYLQYRDFVIATEDTGKRFNGDPLSPVLRVKGLVAYAEPTPEAKALADKFVQGDVWDDPGYFTQAELITLATYYLNWWVAWDGIQQPASSIVESRLFKKYWFCLYNVYTPDVTLAVYAGKQLGRFSLKDLHEIISWQGHWIQKIHFLYQDGDTFGLVVGEGNSGQYHIYTANSLDGPWTETGFIDATPNNPGGDVALVALLQKDCGRLLRQFGVLGTIPLTFPVSIPGITVGKTGEWVGLWAVTLSFNDLGPTYVCRMTKKSGGIELERAYIKLKFKNGEIKSFPGTSSDW